MEYHAIIKDSNASTPKSLTPTIGSDTAPLVTIANIHSGGYMADTEDWITTDDAHDLTGYHVEYIRLLARGGRLKARKFARSWQVSKSDLMRYVAEAQETGDQRHKPHKLNKSD